MFCLRIYVWRGGGECATRVGACHLCLSPSVQGTKERGIHKVDILGCNLYTVCHVPPARAQASDLHRGSPHLHAHLVCHACQDVPKKISSAEVGGNALRQLMTMSKDVYFPLLTNPGNQKGWPEVIVKEFTENLHRFMAQTFVTMGHMNGETLLPLPPDDVYTNMEKNQQDKESIHVLETAVIAWTRQIKDILRQVSSALVRRHCSLPRVP
jgi:hypothetical protein